jgi:uncharacterized protein (DUF1800 family)
MLQKRFHVIILTVCFLLHACFSIAQKANHLSRPFPYASQGLTKEQAAAHLLNRFTYGARPGEVEEVVRMGLEHWMQQQLGGGLQEDTLMRYLSGFKYLNLTNQQVADQFPRPLKLLRMAADDGIIPRDSIKLISREEAKERLKDYVKEKNLHQQSELIREFINQRVIRAVYSRNQLFEVLTGFWFNHFNISLTKPQLQLLAPAYERDAIRPHVLGKFQDLLMATAHAPAMQIYLDNFISAGDNDSLENPQSKQRLQKLMERYERTQDSATAAAIKKLQSTLKSSGLNENYARELMELHTLGVDGGYTQSDVTQAARVLTGWGVYPLDESYAPFVTRLIKSVGEEQLINRGFVRKGDFWFSMTKHDVKEKYVLGHRFNAGGGYEEGLTLLKMLAHHPSTAKFIVTKLATYFVSDHPPASLINKMAKTFKDADGDIEAVLVTMVYAPEFWSKSAVRQKIKSPFELVTSAVRALDADVQAPYQLFMRMDKMGQKYFYYQAPTGFPDRAEYWINTGSLLQRMNFGIDIASQQQRGVYVNLLALNRYHEPENPEAALRAYTSLLLPGREVHETINRLLPYVTAPAVIQKIPDQATFNKNHSDDDDTMMEADDSSIDKKLDAKQQQANKNFLAQVVGIIIGSPEFQRR